MLVESFGRRQALRLLQPSRTKTASIFWNCRHGSPIADGRHIRIRRELSYSRMLDMGGAPSSNNDQSFLRTVDASKNSRIQAVVFDFKVLINMNDANKTSVDTTASEQMATNRSASQSSQSNNEKSLMANFVDVDRVKQVAELLNIGLGSSANDKENDHASNIPSQKAPPKLKDHNPSENDVRAKYASKLKGGLAGIALAKSQVKDTLSKGDAAGHLAARKIAMMGDNTAGGTTKGASKWLPSQAASQLLTLLTHRSIRIGLLPILSTNSATVAKDEKEPKMEDFKAQLKNVIIDKIIPKFADSNNGDINEDVIDKTLRTGILNEFDLDPDRVLLVSDSDPYLRVARDMGLNICRIRPKNARRGNITAHYTVEAVAEVQDVVNEINGISFNVVLNR
mmetsp:Transcript_27577/g.60710  ORF Transcript_27577/g.60710 Transcript_27577/m.60710 type:complete len:396 (-) Transcript_27577:1543-2730(-)